MAVYTVDMPSHIIATRTDERVPVPSGGFAAVTYTVWAHIGDYRLIASYPSMSRASDVVLMSSPNKDDVLSMGELTEGQGL